MKNKAQAMVLASLAADSLALGAHWIYDTEKIEKDIGRVDRLLAPPEKSYHPTKKRGEFTHYGDQTLLLLKSIGEKGGFDLEHFADSWRRFTAATTGYIDRASKDTMLNFSQGRSARESGSGSTDLGGPARIAPLVYRYRDDLETLLQAAREQTAMTHTGPGVAGGTEFIARTAFTVLHGASPAEAVNEALERGVGDIDLDLRLRAAVESAGRQSRDGNQGIRARCAPSMPPCRAPSISSCVMPMTSGRRSLKTSWPAAIRRQGEWWSAWSLGPPAVRPQSPRTG